MTSFRLNNSIWCSLWPLPASLFMSAGVLGSALLVEEFLLRHFWWVVPVFVALPFLGLATTLILGRQLRHRVTLADFKLCPGCLHALHGVPIPGACPECGRRFTETGLRHAWHGVFRKLSVKPPAN